MAAGITFYGRRGDPETVAAQRFLQQNKYRADKVEDLDAADLDWERLRKTFGGSLWPVVETRNPRYGEVLPRGAEDVTEDQLQGILAEDRSLVKAPLLLTPKGGLAGFREQRWRSFLDIGKGRGGD